MTLDTKSQTALSEIASHVLDKAKQAGASSAEVVVEQAQGLSVSVRKQSLESIEYNQDKGLQLTLYVGHRCGHASSADFSAQAIEACINAAMNIARYTEEDKFNGLADASKMATKMPDLDLYHPYDLSVDEATNIALECEQAGLQANNLISNSEGASVSSHSGTDVYANSHGFIGVSSSSRHSVSAALIAGEGPGMQRDYWYDTARNFSDLAQASQIGEMAALRTCRRLNAQRISTGKYPVLLHVDVAKSLWAHLLSAISGSRLYRQSTFLLDSLGKPILPDFVNIHERPHLRRAMGSANFDNEGVATNEKAIVDSGRLQSYLLGSYSARKLGMESTGNSGGVHNLDVMPTQGGDLLKQLGTGVLVTELIGFGVNLVTGDYSRGAFGYWVEDGEIQYPLEEFTIAGQLSDMFKQIVAIGDDVDLRGNIRTGSVLIDSMTVAGS